MTLTGSVAGTPAYMPPEMALHGVAGPQADIYSLGCVAYYMLTGQVVFPEKSTTAMTLAHVQKPPERPSCRTEVPIPASFEDLILRCLAKDPDLRPRSAEDLARQLEALSDTPIFSRSMAAAWWQIHQPRSGGLSEGEIGSSDSFDSRAQTREI